MLYGPGDSEVYVMAMEVDASENILVGGRSRLVQTTVGEGFVFLVDKYGEHLFSKTYASGASAGDVVNGVGIVGTTYVAAGTSDTGTNTFFLLAINAAGVVSKNLVIAQDVTKIANTATIHQMYLQGTEAHIVFDNSVVNIIDVSGAADDYYVGITGEIGDSQIIRIVSHNGNLQYSIFGVINGNLAAYWYDTVVPGNSKNVDSEHRFTVSTSPELITSDVNNDLTPTACWVGIYMQPYVSNFHALHYNMVTANAIPAVTATGAINNLPFPPISLSIVYDSSNSFYMSAMLNNQQGSVYFIQGAVQINKRVALSLHGTFFKAAVTGALFISAGNKIGGESTALLSSQAILFKSDLVLNFALYNCYTVLIADTTTVAIFPPTVGTIDTATRTYVTGTTAQTTDTTIPADSTSHVIRAESTQTDGTNPCVLQPPTFAFIDQTYTTSVDDLTTVKNMVTH
jgi:hypothetical protein